MPDAARRVIGRYELVKPLGLGVHLARDGDRLVALKAMREPPRSLTHPRIAAVFDCVEPGYVAMEYFELRSLRPRLRRLDLAQIGSALEQILTALEHASAHGVVHGRLKPENVFIAGDGGVKVADFGGTSLADTGVALTLATAAYMAPEQPQGGPLGPWTDLYSVGCLAHALRTGTAPFGETGSPVAILLRQVNDVAPRVKGPLADWIEWLMAKDPADRPQSPQEARTALVELLTTRMGRKWRCRVSMTTPPLPTGGGVLGAGDSLRPYLGHLSLAQAGGVLESVLAALADAHANGVVHGHLNPSSMLVTPDRRVAVTGFGLPVALLELPYTTTAYMAPECALERPLGPWTDLYSVGCLAHALFTGQAPYGERGPSMLHVLQHVNEPVVRTPDIDPRVADWIECLLGKEPAGRPQSAGEAWSELEATLIALLGPSWRRDAALPPNPPEPPPAGLVFIDVFEPPALPTAASPRPRTRPGRTLSAAIAGGVAAIAIAAGALAADGSSPTPASVVHAAPKVPEIAARDDLRTGARVKAAELRSAGIARVLEWLERRERALAPALDGPRRVGATKRLWWAYVGAAKRLRQVDVAPADRELLGRLAEAVRLAGCAYGRAAGHPERVRRENRVVLAEQKNATAALENLAAAGYTLPPAAAAFPQIS